MFVFLSYFLFVLSNLSFFSFGYAKITSGKGGILRYERSVQSFASVQKFVCEDIKEADKCLKQHLLFILDYVANRMSEDLTIKNL